LRAYSTRQAGVLVQGGGLEERVSNFGDEGDAKTLAEFWDYLLKLEILGSGEDEPQQSYHTPEVRDRCVVAFLDARRAKREAQFQ
jgi:hypothetical protein